MSGFLGFGQSGVEKKSLGSLDSVFNYGLPAGTASTTSGADAFKSFLAPTSRTQTRVNAAPAINATVDAADAQRRAEATSGTGRSGGTAEFNREAGTHTDASVDDIINKQLGLQQNQKLQAASGLSELGTRELGLAENVGSTELGSATNKEASQSAAFSQIVSSLI